MPQMKAAVFVEPGRIVLESKPVPDVGPLDALLRVTTTTICGTDVHILKGEYPVRKGLTIGHEPVGIIEKLGSAVTGYEEGQRVIAGAITPSGHSYACLCGQHSQDGAGTRHGFKAMGGWQFGNTIDGCQAEFVLVPDAMANLAPVPTRLTDEQVLMCPDIMSTGFSGAESGEIRIGDTVAVFAQGPIGLCAAAGARLMGATTVIGVDTIAERLAMARCPGRRPHGRLQRRRPGASDHAIDGGPRGRCRDRGAGHASDFRKRAARPAAGRHAVEPRGLFLRSAHSARCLLSRPGRHQDRHHALPRREGTHAPSHGCRRRRAGRSRRPW